MLVNHSKTRLAVFPFSLRNYGPPGLHFFCKQIDVQYIPNRRVILQFPSQAGDLSTCVCRRGRFQSDECAYLECQYVDERALGVVEGFVGWIRGQNNKSIADADILLY